MSSLCPPLPKGTQRETHPPRLTARLPKTHRINSRFPPYECLPHHRCPRRLHCSYRKRPWPRQLLLLRPPRSPWCPLANLARRSPLHKGLRTSHRLLHHLWKPPYISGPPPCCCSIECATPSAGAPALHATASPFDFSYRETPPPSMLVYSVVMVSILPASCTPTPPAPFIQAANSDHSHYWNQSSPVTRNGTGYDSF